MIYEKDYEKDDIREAYENFWNEEFNPISEDVVNNPSHYTSGKFEAIEVIEDATSDLEGIKAFACGNALKYIIRHNKKGKPVEDLKKAIFYINKLIDSYEERIDDIPF